MDAIHRVLAYVIVGAVAGGAAWSALLADEAGGGLRIARASSRTPAGAYTTEAS